MSQVKLSLIVFALEEAIRDAGSLRAYARKIGVSPAHLSDVRHYRREPGDKVLRPLGFQKHVERTVTYYGYP